MIKQSTIFIITLLFSFHTTSHTRWISLIGGVITLNYLYELGQENNRILRKNNTALRAICKKDDIHLPEITDTDLPEQITFTGSATQLVGNTLRWTANKAIELATGTIESPKEEEEEEEESQTGEIKKLAFQLLNEIAK